MTEQEAEKFLVRSRIHRGGPQHTYRFPNGLGASVIRNDISYGSEDGLWELAVIEWKDADRFCLTYDTPITDDVIGGLAEEGVLRTLQEISELDKPFVGPAVSRD